MMRVIRAMADDCREQGDAELAEGFKRLANDVEELCDSIFAERKASDSGDSIAYMEARLRTTAALSRFIALTNAAQPGGQEPSCESASPDCGPVEHYDEDGVPLCQRCWDGLK